MEQKETKYTRINFVIKNGTPIATISIGGIDIEAPFERGTYRLLLNKKPADVLDIVEDYINKDLDKTIGKNGILSKIKKEKRSVDAEALNNSIELIKKFMHLKISKKIKNSYLSLLKMQGEANDSV